MSTWLMPRSSYRITAKHTIWIHSSIVLPLVFITFQGYPLLFFVSSTSPPALATSPPSPFTHVQLHARRVITNSPQSTLGAKDLLFHLPPSPQSDAPKAHFRYGGVVLMEALPTPTILGFRGQILEGSVLFCQHLPTLSPPAT